MRIKKFKDFIEKIEKNPAINSGKRFFIESQDVTPLASDLIEFFKKNGSIVLQKTRFDV